MLQTFFMPFLEKNLSRQTLKLALPVMITQLGQVSVQLFDNIIVGNLLGSQALASVSLGNAIFMMMFIFGLGISFAIPPLVSEAHSQNNDERISAVFRHGFVLNMSVGVLLMILMLAARPLLYHLDQPEEIIPDTVHFVSIMAFSVLPFMAFQTLREVSEGLGYTVGVTKATIAANLVNIALNYIFIKGLFGFPPMGVRGSAYATLLARIFMLVFLLIVMLNHTLTRKYLRAFTLKAETFRRSMFLNLWKLGLPTALQMFFEITAFSTAAFICGLVSAKDIAAHQIALSMASFTFNLCVGFSVASTIMVGRRWGERKYEELRAVGINNLKMAFIFMMICAAFFVLARGTLPTFFTKPDDVEVIALASHLLIFAALFQLSDGIQVTALGALRGVQDVRVPSLITFVAYWVITLPLGYYLCVSRGMGATGMWIAFVAGLTFSAVTLVYRFLKQTGRFLKL